MNNKFIFFSTIFIFYSLFLTIFSKEGFPTSPKIGFLPYLSDKPLGEDGFYMLKVAWNIASGNGITYSPGQLTTGIQPLITFFYSFFSWITIKFFDSNKWIFVRFIILIGSLSHVLLAYLVGRLSEKFLQYKNYRGKLIFNVSSSMVLFSFGIFRLSTYGLETTFYLISLCFFYLLLINKLKNNSPLIFKDIFFIGFIVGLIILIRIDALIVLSISLLFLSFKRIIKFLDCIYILLFAYGLSSPWFIYVYKVTGRFIPSSGSAQSSFVDSNNFLERFDTASKAFISHSVSLFTIGRDFLFWGSAITFLLSLGLIIFKNSTRKNIIILLKNDYFISILLSLSILFITYFLTSEAKHFYYRYLSPSIIIFIPTLTLIIVDFPKIKSLYIYFFTLLIFSGQAIGSLHAGKVHNSHSITAGYISSNFDQSKYTIGAFQSGVIGFFNERVFNLDGKVDHEALSYLGGSTIGNKIKNNRIEEYINQKNINVIVDWEGWLKRLVPNLISEKNKNWRKCLLPINNQFGDTRSVCIEKDL